VGGRPPERVSDEFVHHQATNSSFTVNDEKCTLYVQKSSLARSGGACGRPARR
jgi:hypothetical protein